MKAIDFIRILFNNVTYYTEKTPNWEKNEVISRAEWRAMLTLLAENGEFIKNEAGDWIAIDIS